LVGLDQIDQRMLRLPSVYYNTSGIFRIVAHWTHFVG